ncbi:MAG: type II toxin-antitoxin system HicB family antitoxin [bacterium]
MLTEYILKAMSKAVYDLLEDGTYAGKVPSCPGTVAFGVTLFECQEALKSSLEGWLIVKLRHGDEIPIIEGVDLNQKVPLSG